MRIVCLADTQEEPEILDQYLQMVDPLLQRADLIVHLGDGVERVRPFLAKYPRLICLRGNHDNTSDPIQHQFKSQGVRLLFVHGQGSAWQEQPNIWLNKIRHKLGKPPLLDSYYSRLHAKYAGHCDALVYGHIHIPKIETVKQTIFFCPGGLPPQQLLFGNTPPAIGQIEASQLGVSPKLTFTVYSLTPNKKQPAVFMRYQ